MNGVFYFNFQVCHSGDILGSNQEGDGWRGVKVGDTHREGEKDLGLEQGRGGERRERKEGGRGGEEEKGERGGGGREIGGGGRWCKI